MSAGQPPKPMPQYDKTLTAAIWWGGPPGPRPTPWSACSKRTNSRTRGSGADEGVRPTFGCDYTAQWDGRSPLGRRGSVRLPYLVLVILLAGFAAGVIYLFGIQFAAGDVYPEYSSLRTDPMGTKLLFDSLSHLPGVTVSRNYLPMDALAGNGAVLLLGLNPGSFGEDDAAIERVERLARSGHRVVAAMAPPTEYNELMALALGRAWHVKLGGDSNHKHVHRLYFTEARDWNVLDRVGPKLLAIERDFGKGSVVLFAESDDFTNQATVAADRLEMVSMAIGASTHVVFDEQHLGIAETGSFVGLARRFRLTGLALGLAILAALFLWRSASGFPPVVVAQDVSLSGRTSLSGLVTLLRRHIPPGELAAICFQEWLSANRRKVSSERIERAQAIVRGGAHSPLDVALRVAQVVGQPERPITGRPVHHGDHS